MKRMSKYPGVPITLFCMQRDYVKWFGLALCAAATLLVGASGSAFAQTACIPQAVGVPGMSGPPEWTGSWNPPINTGLDDPRWRGALQFTWGSGTSGELARFRALQSSNQLFLSWFIELPVNGSAKANVVYVGFGQHSGTAESPQNFGLFINLNTLTSPTVASTAAGTPTIKSVDATGKFNNPTVSTIPSWVGNTAVWINSPGNSFAVEMMVPINNLDNDTGLDLGTDFNMWFEMEEGLPPSMPTPTVWDAIYPDGRPGVPAAATDVVGVFNIASSGPAPGTWAPFHLQSGSSDPACTMGGISIDWNHIGTNNPVTAQNPTPVASQIIFPKTGGPDPADTNTFFAQPFNGSPSSIPINGINATFRIANWGSIATPAPWTLIPGGNAVPNTSALPSGSLASINSINFQWEVADTATEPWLTEFQGGTKPLHQCMLVELAGPGLTFTSNSVVRNMDFQPVSKMERDAEISVVGLPPLGAAARDVYLYVVSRNMPSVIETAWKDLYNKVFGTPDQRTNQRTMEVLSRMSGQEIAETLPSYVVNAFHDSGKKIRIDNTDYLIVHPQSSFGYYLLPHADVKGWASSLNGATQIAPNFYRIGVPNNGVATIHNSIEAVEVIPIQCLHLFGFSVTPLLFGGIIVVGLMVYRKPRRNNVQRTESQGDAQSKE